jgi:hypothetical protein
MPSPALRRDLTGAGAEAIEDRPAHPFPTLAARFRRTGRTAADLVEIQARHRDLILYIEEMRPPVPRRSGPPEIERVSLSSLLLLLVRDLLNRGESSRIMQIHGGKAASIVFELASLMGSVRSWRVAAGAPRDLAEAVVSIARAEGE